MKAEEINKALTLLGARLELAGREAAGLVVCGGAALITMAYVSRQVTKDVDVVALMDNRGQLTSPEPLPEHLLGEARVVARDLNLPVDWLNNGPSKDSGGIFQLGLPDGFKERLTLKEYGSCLRVYFAGRSDQICFKVYAAVDQGEGRHTEDLMDLAPTEEEMMTAALWAMSQDTSEGFRMVLSSMMRQLNYENVADRI